MHEKNNMPPDNRLEGDTEIRQAQLVMLGLLKHFDKICKDHNLTYWLDGGNLIGAVRHKGFIPWDDDLDVSMPREDYDKFLNLPKEAFPSYIYHDKREEYMRLRDRYSKRIDEGCDADKEFNAIYMDIFPVKKYHYMRKVLARVRMCIPPYTPPSIKNAKTISKKIKRLGATILYYVLTYTGLQFIIRALSFIGPKKYWGYDLTRPVHYHFADEWIFPLTELQFEDQCFPVPGKYHEFLKYNFGNYMQLPPESERNHHNNKSILVTTPCNHIEALDWNTDFPDYVMEKTN